LIELLNNNPLLHIELGSHTDSRGSDTYNEELSSKRAHAAVDYLILNGISADRLTWKGYGEYQLAISCVTCTEEEHQTNRRTEFRVTNAVDEEIMIDDCDLKPL